MEAIVSRFGGHRSYVPLLLGARTLKIGAPGLTTRNKKLLGAKGIATSNKKLLVLLRIRFLLNDGTGEVSPCSEALNGEKNQVDFSDFNAAQRNAVKEKLVSMDVGILINNVGLSYPYTKHLG